jgi:hypothetical protein
MPPLPLVPGVLEVLTGWSNGVDLAMITKSYIRYSGPAPTSANCTAIAAAARTFAAANWAPYFTAEKTFEFVTITDLSSSTPGTGTSNLTFVGTNAGDEVPAATCALISRQTARRYRGGHSRVYLPWLSEDDLSDDSHWLATPIANAALEYRGYELAIAAQCVIELGGTAVPCSVSYYSGFTNVTGPTGRMRAKPTVRVAPLVFDITAWVGRAKVASQRRRNV